MDADSKRQLLEDSLAALSEPQREYAVPYLLLTLTQMTPEERLRMAIDSMLRFAKQHAPPATDPVDPGLPGAGLRLL